MKEIKALEKRVPMAPSGVATMITNGHEVMVETMLVPGLVFLTKSTLLLGPKFFPPLPISMTPVSCSLENKRNGHSLYCSA